MQLIFAILCCSCVLINISSVKAAEEDDKSEELVSAVLELIQVGLDTDDNEKVHEEFLELFGDYGIEFNLIPKSEQHVRVKDKQISIDFGLASDFLTALGKSVKRISIAYNNAGESTGQEIGKLVNNHCAKTLEEFDAKLCPDGAFNEMRTPFKNVKVVSFQGDWLEVGQGRLGLDELFPAMEVLNLRYNYGYIFQRVYPNLVELNTFNPITNAFNSLIEKNPQLKKLHVETASIPFIKYVQKTLPQLETFEFNVPVETPSYDGPVIEFKNLKALSIRDYPHNIRFGKFSFINLKRIELRVKDNIRDEWIALIGNNKDLEHLIISDGTLNDATLLAISKKIPNLIEAKIRCDAGISAKSVVNFIKNKKHMKSIVLELAGGSVSFFKALKKELSEKWKISSIDRHYSVLKAVKLEEYDNIDGNEGEITNTSSLGGNNNQNPSQTNQNNVSNNATDPQSTNQPGGAATALLSKTLIVLFCGIFIKSFAKIL